MTVDKEVVSSIGKGVLVFAAVAAGDTEKEVDTIANKVLRLKLWDDDGSPVCSQTAGLRPPFCVYPWLIYRCSGRRMWPTLRARSYAVSRHAPSPSVLMLTPHSRSLAVHADGQDV